MKPSFWSETFFSKCSKNFSIDLMIMFKVSRRCLQRFSLRWKKNYERTIHTSKYIQKKLTSPNPSCQGGGQQLQHNFNSILRDLSGLYRNRSRIRHFRDSKGRCLKPQTGFERSYIHWLWKVFICRIPQQISGTYFQHEKCIFDTIRLNKLWFTSFRFTVSFK